MDHLEILQSMEEYLQIVMFLVHYNIVVFVELTL